MDLENWWARTVLITQQDGWSRRFFVRCSGFCPYVLLSFTINSYKISRITVILYVCSATIILDEVKHLLGRRRASFAGRMKGFPPNSRYAFAAIQMRVVFRNAGDSNSHGHT